jgi:multidrug resistance protein, MATE family
LATAAPTTDFVVPAGSPYKVILRLALPTIVAMVSQSVVNEVDVIFFARLPGYVTDAGVVISAADESGAAQGMLIPALILFWLFGGSLSALSVGTQALVARRYAEGDKEKAGAVLANAAAFALIAGGILTLLGLIVLPFYVRASADDPLKAGMMADYSRWRIAGVVSTGASMAIKAFFDGIGKTWVHLVAALVMNVLNIFFCWIFIFGHMGAPRMGAEGAGVAGFIATWIGFGIMVFFAARHQKEFRPARRVNLSKKLLWDVLRLSIPACGVTVAMMTGFWLFQKVADILDTRATNEALAAGVTITHNVNAAVMTDIIEILKLTFTACFGFGTATATLVSQSLGAKRPDEAVKFGWASMRLGILVFGIVGLCEGVLFTGPIVNLISGSEAVAAANEIPLRMMAAATPFIGVTLIFSEALFGAGNPKFVAFAQAALLLGVLVPGAFVLGIIFDLGIIGIWMSGCLYAVLASVVMTLKFRQGTWQTIKL